ncbi:MAG: hypothetical protein R2911_37945 [Caldilineaceae bacterium]
MRSLQADRGIGTLVGLGVALTLFLLWIIWFLWAPIARYETGVLVGITRDGWVVAEFPVAAWQSIQQGQTAFIRLDPTVAANSGQNGSSIPSQTVAAIPAIVANVLGQPTNDGFQVSFAVQEYTPALEGRIAGEVAVEIEQLTPALLVARASGQFVDTPALSLSPQQ